MLTVKERQKRLLDLGYYNDKVDGIEGKKTKAAYLKLQKDYFYNKKDIDGIYGKNTDILLNNAYNVNLICKNFKLKEFHCKCNGKYCTGYPHIIDTILLTNIQLLRSEINTPINITSGLRCNIQNKKVGGSGNSRHKEGKAIDFYTKNTSNLTERKYIINKWIKKFVESRYGYCNKYGNLRGKISYPKVPTMGNSIHIDIV